MSLCVYAIVSRPVRHRVLSIANGARLRPVSDGMTAAIVSDCEGPLSPTVRALRGHDAVVRRIARIAPAVLPVRFGTLVDTDRSLIAMLSTWSEELQTALRLVDQHEQMTLRLFGAGAETAPEPRTSEAEAEEHPGTWYLTRLAQAHALAHSAPELEPLREAFAPIVKAERIARHDRGPLLLTAHHLIPRGTVAAYRRILRRCAASLECRAVSSGPWPPYAFAPELRR